MTVRLVVQFNENELGGSFIDKHEVDVLLGDPSAEPLFPCRTVTADYIRDANFWRDE